MTGQGNQEWPPRVHAARAPVQVRGRPRASRRRSALRRDMSFRRGHRSCARRAVPKPPGRPRPGRAAPSLGDSLGTSAVRRHCPGLHAEGRQTPPGCLLRTRRRAISAAHWLLAGPQQAPPPPGAAPPPPRQLPAFPAVRRPNGKRRGPIPPGAGSAGAGRGAEVGAAAAGPAVVGCARSGRALVGCGPRGWTAGSGLGSELGRRPGLRSAGLRVSPARRRQRWWGALCRGCSRGARRGRGEGGPRRAGRAAAPRGGDRPMDPRGPAPLTLRRRDRAQDVGLGRAATTRTGLRRGAAGARGRRAPEGTP